MRQVALGVGLRMLLGVLGAVSVIAGVAVGIAELWRMTHQSFWPAGVGALVCLVVVCGGALLLHGAWRGRIAVRDPAGRASRQRR
jgi:hypothetical protein